MCGGGGGKGISKIFSEIEHLFGIHLRQGYGKSKAWRYNYCSNLLLEITYLINARRSEGRNENNIFDEAKSMSER